MEKKFLDKQGLAEMSKHLKEKYVNKADNEKIVNTVQSLDMKRQIQEMGENIVRKVSDFGGINCMFLTGQYHITNSQANISLPLNKYNDIWNEKVKQNDVELSADLLLTVTKTESNGKYKITQTVQDSFLGVSFTRYSKNSSVQYSDEYLLNYTKTKDVWEWWGLIGEDDWSPWNVDNGNCNYQLTPFTKDSHELYMQLYGLLSQEDKIKLDKLNPNNLPTPISIVDSLTDNGTDKALSANQGKILNETKVGKSELADYAKSTDIKTKLSELTDDPTHRTVTDEEKNKWNKIKPSKSATFVIANYNSSESSKAGADYVVQENESPCDVINDFIDKLPEYGGKIQLTEGNFIEKNDKSIELNKNNVTLEGYGQATQLKAKGQKRKNFIAINNSNIVIKNIYCIGNENIAISLFSNSRNCCVINVRVMTNGTAFSVNGQYHILLNCVGMSIMSNNIIMYITGGNHIIKNCICTALQDDSDAFNIYRASKVICVDCIGKAMGGVIRGNSFNIDNSTDCKFMNCIGETRHYVGFLIYCSSYNSFINCTCTNTEDLPVFMIRGNESTVSRGNIFNACRAVSNGKNSVPQFKLTEETSFNIVTSCVMQNKNVLNKGQSNTVNNNIVLT